MPPELLRLLPLLALVHIAGLASKAPMPAPGKTALSPKKRRSTPAPRAQGARGVGQGHRGASAQAKGGVQSLRNLNGLLPNQQPQYRPHHGAAANPYAVLLNLGNKS